VGTIGEVVQAGTSLWGDYMSAEAQKEAAQAASRAQLQGIQMGIDEQRQGYADVKPMWDPYREAGTTALGDLQRMGAQGQFDRPEWDYQYQGDVSQFLDPSAQFQQDQAARQMQSSFGADQYSGAAMKALQDRSQQMAQTDYGNAYGRMTQDRAFNYQDYMNQFQNQTANQQNQYDRLAGMVNLGTQGTQALTTARTGVANQVSGLQQMGGQAAGMGAAAPGLAAASQYQTFTNPNVVGPAVSGIERMFGGQQQQQQQPQQGYNQYSYQMQNPMQQNLSPQMPQGNI